MPCLAAGRHDGRVFAEASSRPRDLEPWRLAPPRLFLYRPLPPRPSSYSLIGCSRQEAAVARRGGIASPRGRVCCADCVLRLYLSHCGHVGVGG